MPGQMTTCPMRSLRAPELAAQQLSATMAAICEASWQDMMHSEQISFLEASELTVLLADWNAATAKQLLLLQNKTDYWQRLPWKLAALAHHDKGTVKAAASSIYKELTKVAQDGSAAAHHRITQGWGGHGETSVKPQALQNAVSVE